MVFRRFLNSWLWFHFIFKLILGLVPLAAGAGTANCPANEEWNSCGSACAERYCCDSDDKGHCKNQECPEVCEQRCECIKGYARDFHSGNCIPKADCLALPASHAPSLAPSPAPPACPDNEVYNNCNKGYEPFCCEHSMDAKSSRQFAQVDIIFTFWSARHSYMPSFLLVKPCDWSIQIKRHILVWKWRVCFYAIDWFRMRTSGTFKIVPFFEFTIYSL